MNIKKPKPCTMRAAELTSTNGSQDKDTRFSYNPETIRYDAINRMLL